MEDLVTATARKATAAAPAWALLERKLIAVMEEAALLMFERYTDPGGVLYFVDDVDDLYERFYNWGLFYAMGADEKLLHMALDGWNATTRACDDRSPHPIYEFFIPQIHNEYYNMAPASMATTIAGKRRVPHWHHQAEGNMAFYDFGVADPGIGENQRRAERFAAMYMGEDPAAPNYDPRYRVIRSPMPTSQGPMHQVTALEAALWLQGGTGAEYRYYGIRGSLSPVVEDLEADWIDHQPRRNEITDLFNEIVLQADTPNNLAVTALVTNAYLYSGEEKYKKWVLEYTQAWIERMESNGGLMPDNVGPTGVVGERRNGQWWGGMHGWNHYQGYNVMFHGLTIAAECCLLLTGDYGYLELLRSQIKLMFGRSYEADDGQLVTPNRHGRDGWGHYLHSEPQVMRFQDLAHLYHASLAEDDRRLVHQLRDGDIKTDWCDVAPCGEKGIGATEKARFQYYEGSNPDWPEKILSAEYESALSVLDQIQNDNRDREQIKAEHKGAPNPVFTKGLTQVAMGAPQSVYCGGLLRATLRYFDAKRRRPGLPEDVCALVDELGADRLGLQLVSLSSEATREVIVQAEAFGEHTFCAIEFVDGEEKRITVDSRHLRVSLPPHSTIRLKILYQRFAHQPAYTHPPYY